MSVASEVVVLRFCLSFVVRVTPAEGLVMFATGAAVDGLATAAVVVLRSCKAASTSCWRGRVCCLLLCSLAPRNTRRPQKATKRKVRMSMSRVCIVVCV